MRIHVAVLLVLTCYVSQSFAQRKPGGRGPGGPQRGKSDMVTNMVSRECKTVGMTDAGIVILKKSISVQQQEQGKPSMSPEALEKLQTRVKELCKSSGMTEADLAFWDTCSENIKNKFLARRGGKPAKEEKKEDEKKEDEKKEDEKKEDEKKEEK